MEWEIDFIQTIHERGKKKNGMFDRQRIQLRKAGKVKVDSQGARWRIFQTKMLNEVKQGRQEIEQV